VIEKSFFLVFGNNKKKVKLQFAGALNVPWPMALAATSHRSTDLMLPLKMSPPNHQTPRRKIMIRQIGITRAR